MKDAKRALGILTAINLLNYLDRFLLPPLVPLISKDLQLDDTEAGWLGSAFLLVYSFASPLFGRFGDQKSRPFLIFIGVFIWSIATAMAGFAVGFISLFLARSLVGVGEASYGTIAPSLLSDFYPIEKRERVMALFYVAVPIGASLGYILGGGIGAKYSWRVAFWVAGFPGALLAFLTLFLSDPPRGAQDAPVELLNKEKIPWKRLLQNKAYWYIVLGYIAYTFAIGAASFWLPTFVSRERHMTLSAASQTIGGIAALGGIIGTLLGGFIASKLRQKITNANLWVSGVSVLIAVPMMWLTLELSSFWALRAAFLACEIFLFMSIGPIGAALVNSIEPSFRSTGQAISIFLIHMLGDVISPPIIGFISTRSSLETAMMVLPPMFAVGGFIWCLGAWMLPKIEIKKEAL
jgi:MFS family permease